MEIVIVSGLSGAGKSRVAGVLEDLDFYCVDNLPIMLMPKFADLCLATRGRYERVALVTDVRNIESFGELFSAINEMHEMGCEYRIIFVEASTETIVKRYKESRRRHPLNPDGTNLEGAVIHERELMDEVRQKADIIIDTTNLTLGKLQRKLVKLFSGSKAENTMNISVTSFGYKYGIPIEADLVIDVRFLPNPFYIPELKELTGTDEKVSDFIFGYEITNTFLEKLTDMIAFLLPQYVEEGKPQLSICIGCTGGHHRSVAVAQKLTDSINALGYSAECVHRDIGKN